MNLVLKTDINEECLTDFYLNDKINNINEKLKNRRATLMDKNEFTVLNPTSVSARQKHHNFDNFNIDEEFRSFNIFTPKIYISIKTTLRTTLSKVQQSYDQKNTIASAEINSLNNNIKQSDLKYKTFKKTNTFNPNIRFFFETKSKEYHFQDISEKR